MEVTVPEFSLPTVYGENNLILMVRDPNCLFAYWELAPEQKALIRAESGSGVGGGWSCHLRLYDLTGLTVGRDNPHSFQDLPVDAYADNYYLKEVGANRSYCVDLGIHYPDGRFVTLIRSNVVHTPRDTMADGSGRVRVDMLDRLPRVQAAAGLAADRLSSDSVYQYYGNLTVKSTEKGEE